MNLHCNLPAQGVLPVLPINPHEKEIS